MGWQCQKLSYQVGGARLLNRVSTQFNQAQVSVILGKNGAGKSTLLKLMSLEIQPQQGEICFDERSLHAYSLSELAQRRAVLPQKYHLPFSMSVEAFIGLGAEVQNAADAERVITTMMTQFDLHALAGRDVLTLSGGEQQRVQLARVMAQIWPDESRLQSEQPLAGYWLLLDEWTNGLDLHHQQCFISQFKQWARQGLGVVMVLHDLNVAAQVADDIKLLSDGELRAQGSPQQVLTKEHVQLYLDLPVDTYTRQGDHYPLVLSQGAS